MDPGGLSTGIAPKQTIVDIRIDHCILHGPEGDVRRAQQVLQNCPWPPAGEAEVLILRRLAVRARPERLPAQLYQSADALIGGSIDGWSDGAAAADCLRFRSEADMLARLSLDLAAGRAARLWFWQSFRRYWAAPPNRALAALWLDEAPRLPAITRLLREQRALPTVWRQIDRATADALLTRLLGPAAADQLRHGHPQPAQAPATEQAPAAMPMPGSPTGRDARLGAALNAFGPHPSMGDAAQTTRDQLALTLAVAVEHPHWIAAPDAGPRLLALFQAISAPATPAPDPPSPPRATPTPITSGTETEQQAPPAQTRQGPRPPSPTAPDSALSAATQEAGASADTAEPRDPGQPSKTAQASRADADQTATIDSDEDQRAAILADGDTWYIAQGGLFYLLNLLNWRPVRERLFADAEAMAFPSGWGWLYRLGEQLALEPEPPLSRCLARLSNLPEARFPADLPPLTAAADIAALGAERYARFGLWHPRLLQVPARIRYRRPELDIDYAMADLDIAVRGAALDVDPGWVDWLGTVVRFHYR